MSARIDPGLTCPDCGQDQPHRRQRMSCPFAHWAYLDTDHRARLRGLFAYQLNAGRLAHLFDRPRCPTCKETA